MPEALRKTGIEDKQKVEAKPIHREFEFRQETFNEEARTVEIVWSTGADVMRNTFLGLGEDFVERLSMEPEHIRMVRLQRGAPFLNMHRNFSLGMVLGVLENPRIEGGKGIATVRFSDREEVEPIFRDVKNGILRNVSVGYRVHKFEEIGRDENDVRILRAVDWEPFEVSLVTIGADPLAQTREEVQNHQCEVVLRNKNRGNSMPTPEDGKQTQGINVQTPEGRAKTNEPAENQPQPTNEPDNQVVENARGEGQKAGVENERKRVSAIFDVCQKAGLEAARANEFINQGHSIEKVRELVIDEMSQRDSQKQTQNHNPGLYVGEDLGREARMKGAQNAILYRANTARYKIDEHGSKYRYMSLLDLAREFAEAAGHRTRNMRKHDIVRVAMHSTIDFPEVLANSLRKSLRDAYQAAPQTFGPLVRRVPISDFKQVSRVQLGDAPDLKKVAEDGEFKRGSVGENAEKYSLDTYGHIIGVTRQMIINDDLDAFSRLPELQGRAAADLESDLVWGEIISNPTLSDGNALFSSAHSNILDPGAVPSVTELSKMRAAMAKQTGLNGRLLNVPMRWLIVPSDLETDAEKLVTNITPRAEGDVNPFVGRLQVISEPRLATDGDADDWYTSSSAQDIDIIELGTLDGEEGPMMEQKEGFEVDAIEFKIRHDVAAKVIDFRGLQKNEGGSSE